MNKFKASWVCTFVIGCTILAFSMNGCDFLNPTDVRNPQTTEESLESGGTGASGPFLNGVAFRYSDAIEDISYFTDVVSDNYDNVATFISPEADFPRNMRPSDLTLNGGGGPYFEVQELRSLADFTITGVIPNDAQATPDNLAEALFYRGMSNLLAGENFSAVPTEENGPLVPSEQLLQLAVADFTEALNTSQHSGFEARIHIVKARAYRLIGDKANAEVEANAALGAASPDFVFPAQFDAANNINSAYNFAVSRALNDVQPLPRLDFLDPKYLDRDSPIASVKMEEAHLILAEAALSNGDNAGAVGHLVNAINLAKSRGTSSFVDDDPRELRPQAGTVQAGPSASAISGLILPRSGLLVQVPTISGSSLNAAAVSALTDPAEIFYTLYLARQEIFFYEGRRMSDLGIKLPIMNREIETNTNINAGDLGTVAVVPDYIPAEDGLDAFTFDGSNTVISVDMNQVLTDNRISPFSMPF